MVFPIQFSPFSQNWNRNAEWKTDLLIYFGTIFWKKQTPSCQVTLRVPFTWEIISSPTSEYIVLLLLSASRLVFRAWRLDFLGWWISEGELPPCSASQMQCMALGRLHWWSQPFQHLSLFLGADLHLDTSQYLFILIGICGLCRKTSWACNFPAENTCFKIICII